MSGTFILHNFHQLYPFTLSRLNMSLQPGASSALAQIRRESLDMFNRLHSIEEDIAFVNLVRGIYVDLPLIREFISNNLSVTAPTNVDFNQPICVVVPGTLTPLS
jgi:hypothetical protein